VILICYKEHKVIFHQRLAMHVFFTCKHIGTNKTREEDAEDAIANKKKQETLKISHQR
jgi:hypothetical protein